MKKSPYKNVKDVLEIAKRAFAKVTPKLVRDCYAHVEEQEEWYRRLHKMEPLLNENIETIPEIETIEPIADVEPIEPSTENEPIEPITEKDTITFDENGQILIPIEAEIEIIEAEATPQSYACSICNYETRSFMLLNNHLKSHYKCEECGKEFKGPNGKRNYTVHLKTHQQKSPKTPKIRPSKPPKQQKIKKSKKSYNCLHCDKVFPFLSYLNRHTKHYHTIDLMKKIDFELISDSPVKPLETLQAAEEITLISESQPSQKRTDLMKKNELINDSPVKQPETLQPAESQPSRKRKQNIVPRNDC